jgi:hypothetical protein
MILMKTKTKRLPKRRCRTWTHSERLAAQWKNGSLIEEIWLKHERRAPVEIILKRAEGPALRYCSISLVRFLDWFNDTLFASNSKHGDLTWSDEELSELLFRCARELQRLTEQERRLAIAHQTKEAA